MNYIVLHELDRVRLSEKVTEYMARGYMPHGGLCVVALTNGTTNFYQAVVSTSLRER